MDLMPQEQREKLSQTQIDMLMDMSFDQRPSIDFSGIANILLWLVGLYVLSSIFNYIQGFVTTGVSQKVAYNLRRDIAAKMNRMPLKYFDRTSHGDVLSRITNDVDTVAQSLNQSISQLVTAVTTILRRAYYDAQHLYHDDNRCRASAAGIHVGCPCCC